MFGIPTHKKHGPLKIQSRSYRRNYGRNMKTLIVAVLVACFCYCKGQDPTCVTSPPREEEIDGQSDVQPTEIEEQIINALSRDEEVSLAVDAITAQRALVNNYEVSAVYTDTCPRKLVYITSLYVSNTSEKCYVVSPKQQRVTYAVCGGTNCYGSIFYKSQCVRTGWTRMQFWVWCPTCGFKLIARWYPQCCSCYRWTPCLEKA